MRSKAVSVCVILGLVLFAGTVALQGQETRKVRADKTTTSKVSPLKGVKIEETEATSKLDQPHYGYTGVGGSFVVAPKHGVAVFGVHQHPDYTTVGMGVTQLKYVGPRQLGGIDGWVFETKWDGKKAPSKMFFSAHRVYFGLGVSAYIAADYREETKWAWKMVPLHRMPILKEETEKEGKKSE